MPPAHVNASATARLCAAVIQKVQQTICKNNGLVKSRTLHTVGHAQFTLTVLSAAKSLPYHSQPTTLTIACCNATRLPA